MSSRQTAEARAELAAAGEQWHDHLGGCQPLPGVAAVPHRRPALHAADERGVCPHWSLQGWRCTACGREFSGAAEYDAAVAAVAAGEEG